MHVFLVGMRQRGRRKSVGSSHDADRAEAKDWELAFLGRRDRKRVELVAGGSLVSGRFGRLQRCLAAQNCMEGQIE